MNPWRRFWCIFPLAVMVAFAVPLSGCGDDDDPTGPELVTLADLAGSWDTSSYVVTDKANSAATLDLVQMGATLGMVADAAGNFTGSLFIPEAAGGPLTLPFVGTVELLDQETIKISMDPEFPPLLTGFTGPFTYDGNTMTATDENGTFDFGAGEVPATAVVTFVRD